MTPRMKGEDLLLAVQLVQSVYVYIYIYIYIIYIYIQVDTFLTIQYDLSIFRPNLADLAVHDTV